MSSNLICKFFALGRCNKGSECRFAHQLDPAQMNVPQQTGNNKFLANSRQQKKVYAHQEEGGLPNSHIPHNLKEGKFRNNNNRHNRRGNQNPEAINFEKQDSHQNFNRGLNNKQSYSLHTNDSTPQRYNLGQGQYNQSNRFQQQRDFLQKTTPIKNIEKAPEVGGFVIQDFKNEFISEINNFREKTGLSTLIVKKILYIESFLIFLFEDSTFVFLYNPSTDKFIESQQYLHPLVNDLLLDLQKVKLDSIGLDVAVISYNNFNEFSIKLNSEVIVVDTKQLFNYNLLFRMIASQDGPIGHCVLSDNFLVTSVISDSEINRI